MSKSLFSLVKPYLIEDASSSVSDFEDSADEPTPVIVGDVATEDPETGDLPCEAVVPDQALAAQLAREATQSKIRQVLSEREAAMEQAMSRQGSAGLEHHLQEERKYEEAQKAEREAHEQAMREEQERLEKERIAAELAEKEEQEARERERERAEAEAREEQERIEREAREAQERAEQEEKDRIARLEAEAQAEIEAVERQARIEQEVHN